MRLAVVVTLGFCAGIFAILSQWEMLCLCLVVGGLLVARDEGVV